MISVIMLTYNRENFVGRMIECILSQTMTDFEFIIVNNGSSDRSGVIADEYARKDNRICVIHREKGNIGSGRNAGLDVARGEYIAFVDDDDICDDDFLQFLYDLARESDADISICGAADKSFDEKRCMGPQEALEMLLWRKRYNVQFPTKLIRKSLFEGNRFLETGKYDDIYLMPRILACANKISYHGLPKYDFMRHESNNSAWTQNYSLLEEETLQEYLDVYRERTQWLIGLYPAYALKWRYFEWSFMISMVEKIHRLELKGCENLLAYMTHELREHKDTFLAAPEILNFEKDWMNRFI